MSTLIRALVYNENAKRWNANDVLSKYLANSYNNQNFKIQYHLNDVIQIDGGYKGFEDDLIYVIRNKTHYFKEKNYVLILYLKIYEG